MESRDPNKGTDFLLFKLGEVVLKELLSYK